MVELDKRYVPYQPDRAEENEAIRHLERSIVAGKHWYLSLLEAICLWDNDRETYNGRTYHYLVSGEAFDWLLLAERLCQAVDGLLPDAEKTELLFHGRPPIVLSKKQFREFIGGTRYRQYLNFFYGVIVEGAIAWAVQEEVRKERWSWGFFRETDTTGEVYRRIYGATKTVLLKNSRRSSSYPQSRSISLTELKEFTYWLFKYRLKHCDKAKVASDTKKGLNWLNRNGFSRQPDRRDIDTQLIDM